MFTRSWEGTSVKKPILISILWFCFFTYIYSDTALDLYIQGKNAQYRDDWYTATELYQEALILNPAYGDAWFGLAECAYELDQYDLAVTYSDRAATYIKNRTDIPNLKGFAFIGLGRLDEARQVFLQVLALYPNDIEARFGLAQLDIFDGRFSGAELYYLDALKRETQNKKALLSLALIADELGEVEKARSYIEQALRSHSGRADVHYFAAYLAAKDNNIVDAEMHVRTAIRLNGDYDEAYKLLANILFADERYSETIDICDYRIYQNRNTPSAWYIKGLANEMLGRTEQAFSAWEVGLGINPQDEIMRAAFELLIFEETDIEDDRRPQWAEYHLEKAKIAQRKYLSKEALYEYQRTLRIDPLNVKARLALADILLQEGYAESYLSQLQFLQAKDLATENIDDLVESYSSILSNTLPLQWGVDPFYLDKTRWTIALSYPEEVLSLHHQQALSITAGMLADIFNSSQTILAVASPTAVSGYAQAFRNAREQGYDFFALLDISEGDRDITVVLDLYLSQTGNKVASWKIYRTGNDRFSAVLQKLRDDITNVLPQKGRIIERRGSNILIDMGRKDGAVIDQVFTIYEKNSVQLADSSMGLKYDTTKALGTVTLTAVGEDISQGTFSQTGFYDLVNIGDEVLPNPIPVVQENTDVNAEENQKAPIEASKTQTSAEETSVVDIKKQTSVLYDLIQTIR